MRDTTAANRARIAHTQFSHTINGGAKTVVVRVMHVNPDATVTVQDGAGHVWFGVRFAHLMALTSVQAQLADSSIPVAPQFIRASMRAAGTLQSRTSDGALRCTQCAGTVESPAQCTLARHATGKHAY